MARDVWPSHRIEDKERDHFQQHGELIFEYAVEFGDIINMLDDLGIELEDARFEIVDAMHGLAVKIKLESGVIPDGGLADSSREATSAKGGEDG